MTKHDGPSAALVLVWCVLQVLSMTTYGLGPWTRTADPSLVAYDTLVLPLCETCKQIEPWTVIWILNGCGFC
jgi:hypothetical protein